MMIWYNVYDKSTMRDCRTITTDIITPSPSPSVSNKQSHSFIHLHSTAPTSKSPSSHLFDSSESTSVIYSDSSFAISLAFTWLASSGSRSTLRCFT